MQNIQVGLGQRSYEITVQAGLLSQSDNWLSTVKHPRQIAIIGDDTVMGLYGRLVETTLTRAGHTARVFDFTHGEASKTLQTAEALYTALISWGLRRDGLIVALGGGVSGDLAGFVAATLYRGMDFIQIPTTLLAQVDSSVGGKTGINHTLGKNLIGSFHQPRRVLIDPTTLHTLPQRERWAGLGEVAKYAFLDEAILNLLETRLDALAALSDMACMDDLIARCCRLKASVVAEDERESGRRRVLNLGHTLGHALEQLTHYLWFRHGEAVAWGLNWAVFLSEASGLLRADEAQRLRRLTARIERPALPANLTAEALISAMQNDKKQTRDGLHCVLLKTVGQPVIQPVNGLEAWTRQWLMKAAPNGSDNAL